MKSEVKKKSSKNVGQAEERYFIDREGNKIPAEETEEYISKLLNTQKQHDAYGRKMRVTVGLSSKNEPNDLQHYCRLNLSAPRYKVPLSVSQPTIDRVKQEYLNHLHDNPSDYFNFGFDRPAFERYLTLIVLRRSQRAYIFEKIRASHLEKSIETREKLNSNIPKHVYHPHYDKNS